MNRRSAVTAVLTILLLVGALYPLLLYLPSPTMTLQTSGSSGSVINTVSTVSTSTNTAPFLFPSNLSCVSQPSIPQATVPKSTSANWSNWVVDNPSFLNGSVYYKIDYPPDYGILVNFTLNLINSERATAGLCPVTLSSIPSAQQHADDMYYFNYFSHWDVQDFKPYMRYTMLGGEGYAEENAGINACSSYYVYAVHPNASSSGCNLQSVEYAINSSEYSMMYQDSYCCNNGHRDNILNPFHNRVSIGIAFGTTGAALGLVFFVEDFENDYIVNSSGSISGSIVTLQGSTQNIMGGSIAIAYDPTPTFLNYTDLHPMNCAFISPDAEEHEPPACRYVGAYDPGQIIGTTCSWCGTWDNMTMKVWQQDSSSGDFKIVFDISKLQSIYGNGVYTLYLFPAGKYVNPITSLSIFVGGYGQ